MPVAAALTRSLVTGPDPTSRSPSVTSNVAQSYPYTSETDAQRVAAISSLIAAREGLEATIEAETSPLDEQGRWWVWKCPTPGCGGLLHVAGYARDLHALFTVCDGSCAKTFLR